MADVFSTTGKFNSRLSLPWQQNAVRIDGPWTLSSDQSVDRWLESSRTAPDHTELLCVRNAFQGNQFHRRSPNWNESKASLELKNWSITNDAEFVRLRCADEWAASLFERFQSAVHPWQKSSRTHPSYQSRSDIWWVTTWQHPDFHAGLKTESICLVRKHSRILQSKAVAPQIYLPAVCKGVRFTLLQVDHTYSSFSNSAVIISQFPSLKEHFKITSTISHTATYGHGHLYEYLHAIWKLFHPSLLYSLGFAPWSSSACVTSTLSFVHASIKGVLQQHCIWWI